MFYYCSIWSYLYVFFTRQMWHSKYCWCQQTISEQVRNFLSFLVLPSSCNLLACLMASFLPSSLPYLPFMIIFLSFLLTIIIITIIIIIISSSSTLCLSLCVYLPAYMSVLMSICISFFLPSSFLSLKPTIACSYQLEKQVLQIPLLNYI